MSVSKEALLANSERRLAAETFDAIATWIDGRTEFSGSEGCRPMTIFNRFKTQAAGAALQHHSADFVRLVVKAHLQNAGWLHDSMREHDWVALTTPLWISNRLDLDAPKIFHEAAIDYGDETAQAMSDIFGSIESSLEWHKGPVDAGETPCIAVQLANDTVDFEAQWDLERHSVEVDWAQFRIDGLEKRSRSTSSERRPGPAPQSMNSVVHPDESEMSWFDGKVAPAGTAVWDDSDPLQEHRSSLDNICLTGQTSSTAPPEIIEAYVRDRATEVARNGNDEALTQGLSVAAGFAEEMVPLMGHATWHFEGSTGAQRFDTAYSSLPTELAGVNALTHGSDLVKDELPDGIVLTGLYTGLKYSKPYKTPRR